MALNIADLFEHATDAFGDRIAVACGDRHVTYRELEERVNRLAHHLAGIGVGPGDRVGLYARNSIEATETHVRRQVAGYKVPRSVWLVDVIGRAPSGKPDYGWARQYAADRPASLEHPDAAPPNLVPCTTGGHPAA
jgi:acyl-CoA synthetase (AMP-forming)/AMP-acid ligase II